ncbi:MAG: antitoxin MazE, partial [Campylobacterota bacterium]|nr:antitoxin MazE [Campylobacterota bacterium]
MIVQGDTLLLRSSSTPRKGWFDNYDQTKDIEPLAEMIDLQSEQEEWEW